MTFTKLTHLHYVKQPTGRHVDRNYSKLVNEIDYIIDTSGIDYLDEDAEIDFQNLDRDTQSELSGLMFQSDGEEAFESILDEDIRSAFLKILHFDSQDNREDLASLIIDKSISVNSNKLQRLINERLLSKIEDIMDSDGLRLVRTGPHDYTYVKQGGF